MIEVLESPAAGPFHNTAFYLIVAVSSQEQAIVVFCMLKYPCRFIVMGQKQLTVQHMPCYGEVETFQHSLK